MLVKDVEKQVGAVAIEQVELDGFDMAVFCHESDERLSIFFREFAVGGECQRYIRFWADDDSLYTAIAYFLSREHEELLEDLNDIRAVEAYDGQVILSYLDGSDRLVVKGV